MSVLLFSLLACDAPAPLAPGLSATPLAPSTRGEGFTLLDAASTGLVFTNTLTPEHNKPYLHNGAGLAIGDVDGNGLPDVYIAGTDAPNKLFLQQKPWVFEDRTQESGVALPNKLASGSALADLDGDGDLDLLVGHVDRPNAHFVNDGTGHFHAHPGSGLELHTITTMPAITDIDGDGDLDVYLLTNRKLHVADQFDGEVKVRMVDGKPTVHPDFLEHYALVLGHFQEAGYADLLLVNEGDGTFVDATAISGIQGFDMGLSATWLDYDEDGKPDLYVANDMKGPDHLYHNLGDARFEDVAPEMLPVTSWFSMGSDAGDLDGDGRIDLMVGDMSASTHYLQKTTMGAMGKDRWFLEGMDLKQYMRNTVLLNTGTERFEEAAWLTGMASTDWSWSIRIDDLDNDGREDVFVTNGHARNANDSDLEVENTKLLKAGKVEEAKALGMKMPELPLRNRAFRNDGDLVFEPVEKDWGLDARGISHSASFTDFDRDGDLDLIVNNQNAPVSLYRNDHGGNAILVSLSHGANTRGLGARVEVEVEGQVQVREMQLTHGYLTNDEAVMHFGLGTATAIDRLTVFWDNGSASTYKDLEAGQHYRIDSMAAETKKEEAPQAPWFTSRALPVSHQERDFDDYAREPLLPWRLSMAGPVVGSGDVDGDGQPEVYVGGSAGHAGLLISATRGSLKPLEGPWAAPNESEEAGVAFADLDGDGRVDLYVSSGGVEHRPGAASYTDRVYLNRKTGWERRAGAEGLASGPVVAEDFDGDGDIDVFVGGRTIPGRYPDAERSQILWNNGQADFEAVDVALDRAVQGATSGDVDGDGDLDLVVATAWGPVRILHSDDRAMVDRTPPELLRKTGMWNDVALADFNGDGQLDIVASNLGHNTKYHASDEAPMQIYVGDMDGNGTQDIIEAEREDGKLFPVRGLSCTSAAIPSIGESFESYDAFARAELDQLYEEALENATIYEANWLDHTVFLQSKGGFEAHALPRRSQIAPGFGLGVLDADGDGHLDVFMAQNWFAPQPETGQFNGGLSVLLKGSGDGDFAVVPPAVSGILLAEDATGVSVIDVQPDGQPDLLVGINQGPARLLVNQHEHASE